MTTNRNDMTPWGTPRMRTLYPGPCGHTSPAVVPGQTIGFLCTRERGHDGAHQAADKPTQHGSVVWATWIGGRLLDGVRMNIDLGGCCPECGLPNDDGDDALCASCLAAALNV